jgi:hypothetical protein
MNANDEPPWSPPAAYLYILKLDPLLWAWEYLRRNPNYRTDFHCAMTTRQSRSPTGWGLLAWEDPRQDARFAEPEWDSRTGGEVLLAPAPAGEVAPPFDFWAIPGRKSVRDDRDYLKVTARGGSEVLGRVQLAGTLRQGDPMAISLTAGRGFTVRAQAAYALLRWLKTFPDRACRPSLSAVTHMRILQALDGDAAGASHREIARRLFGAAAQVNWSADSRWRARIRYLVKCGRARSAHGYRRIAGIDRTMTGPNSPPAAASGEATLPPRHRGRGLMDQTEARARL